jgi:hypothetical protein
MEVEASGPSGPAKLLRLEAQGTLLIGLFDGLIDTVTLHEPPEGVHFGFDVNGTLSKNPRRLAADGNLGVGTEIVTSPPTPLHVAYRGGAAVGVLDIEALADALNTRLSPPQFTSAEFALEMVAGVQLVTFTLS